MKCLQNSGQDHDCGSRTAPTRSAVNKGFRFSRTKIFVQVDQVEDQVVVAFTLFGFCDDLSSSDIYIVIGTRHGQFRPPFEVQKSD